jgi:hypothetical protein
MDPNLNLVLQEFTRMLRAEIRQAFADSMRATGHVPVRSPPFVPAQEVQAAADDERFNESVCSPPFVPAPEIKADDDDASFSRASFDFEAFHTGADIALLMEVPSGVVAKPERRNRGATRHCSITIHHCSSKFTREF